MAFKLLLIISVLIVLAALEETPKAEHPDETTLPPTSRQSGVLFTFPAKPFHTRVVRPLFTHLKKERMEQFVKDMSAFRSRSGYSLSDPHSEVWLTNHLNSIHQDYTGGSGGLRKIPYISKGGQSYTQQNIIVSIEGQNPTLKDELVILGAHYDTSGSDGTPRRPGADDNASGCAVLVEMLNIIVEFGLKFNHTLEFHFYTANEGQKGSADVAFKYKQEGKKIRGMVNFDSLGFKSGDEISIGFVESLMLKGETVWSPALTSFVKMLVENYLEWKIKPVAVDCSNGEERCSSDYISWHRENHPWAAVTEINENPHRNTEKDSIDQVNFEQVNEFAKLALAVTIELGELALTPHIPDASWSSAFNSAPGCGWCGVGMIFIFIHICFTIFH